MPTHQHAQPPTGDGEPPPPRRRDQGSPAAGHDGPPDLLAEVDAWCRRILRRPSPQLPRLDGDLDEIAVERACNGDRTITLNRAELHAAWQRLEGRGLSSKQIGPVLGVSDRTIVRWRQGYHRPHPRRTIGPLAERRGLAA